MKKMLAILPMVVSILMSLSSAVYGGDVHLAVAASLKEVVNELSDNFARKHPSANFKKNYGGSGALAKQTESGAPADIFISANTEWMDYLKGKGMLDDKSVDTLTYNVLVFVGQPELKVSGLHDVARLGKVAIGSPKSVPAGEYALTALKKAGIYQQLEHRLVMAKDVRECLLYADRGEVEGAFVYRTDALLVAKRARILFTVPQEYYPRVTYPMALTKNGANNLEAAAFYAYLHTDEARSVLKKFGFLAR